MTEQLGIDKEPKYCPRMSTATEKVICMGDKCEMWVMVKVQVQGKLAVTVEERGMCVELANYMKPTIIMQQSGGGAPGGFGQINLNK